MQSMRVFRIAVLLLYAAIGSALAAAAEADDVPMQDRLAPAEVARMLELPAEHRPLILQVGSHVLYAEAHIPGSEYVGAAGQEPGIRALVARTRTLPHEQAIVIYCGCCPWARCPNIRAAYRQLVSSGFTHVRALYLADDFGTNWVARGYPVEKGR